MYEGTWESLRTHRVPVWYDDAKLGVFIHWGLYSVPGWAPRGARHPAAARQGRARSACCGRTPTPSGTSTPCRSRVGPTHEHHAEVYGEDYPYDNFVRTFNDASAGADLEAVADLCQAAGARYVVLTTKHHDGFALWPSSIAHPVKGEYHARRDLVGDLTEAVRARRMRMGLYYSGGYDWPYNEAVLTTGGRRGAGRARMTVATSSTSRRTGASSSTATSRRSCGTTSRGRRTRGCPQLFAYYYNTVEEGVINDRWKEPGLAATSSPTPSCAVRAPSCRRCGRSSPSGGST